jgi:hypothetical protein
MRRRSVIATHFMQYAGQCPVCGREYWVAYGRGRLPKYCSDACKQAAYRERRYERRRDRM